MSALSASSSLTDEHIEVLKQGDTFGVFDRYGDIHSLRTGSQGLYHEGTRFLSRFELAINGERPLLLSSTVKEDNVLLSVDLMNPDMTHDGTGRDHARSAARVSDSVLVARDAASNAFESTTIASVPFRSGSPSQWMPILPICSKSVGRSEIDEADAWRPSRPKMEYRSDMRGWIMWIGGSPSAVRRLRRQSIPVRSTATRSCRREKLPSGISRSPVTVDRRVTCDLSYEGAFVDSRASAPFRES